MIPLESRVHIYWFYFWHKLHISSISLPTVILIGNCLFWKTRIHSNPCQGMSDILCLCAGDTIQQQTFDRVLQVEQGNLGNQYWQDINRVPLVPANYLFNITCLIYCSALSIVHFNVFLSTKQVSITIPFYRVNLKFQHMYSFNVLSTAIGLLLHKSGC